MRAKLALYISLALSSISYSADDLRSSIGISASGMDAQSARLKIIAQNIANKDSTASSQDDLPYRRQVTIMKNRYDKNREAGKVIYEVRKDNSEFIKIYNPQHPASDSSGYVLMPNVNSVIENADSKDAMRSYEANLSMIESSKNMYTKTIDLLK